MNGDNLKHFRDEWVRELDNKLKRPHEEQHHHYFYDDRNHARIEDNGTAVYAKKHINSERNREITLEGDAKDYGNTGSFLDLGNYKEMISHRNKPEREDSYSNIKKAQKETKENFLDILIADIDELISLPFFDLELPREIAIEIFQYLDVADLGNCARVNKKWKILADDDLIWFNLCKSRGFVNDDSCLLEREGWKEIFKVESNSAKCFHQNWKQRICQISELEYEKGMKNQELSFNLLQWEICVTSGLVKTKCNEECSMCLDRALSCLIKLQYFSGIHLHMPILIANTNFTKTVQDILKALCVVLVPRALWKTILNSKLDCMWFLR